MADGKASFSLSGKVSKFKEDWERWIRRQIKERGGDRSVLCEYLAVNS